MGAGGDLKKWFDGSLPALRQLPRFGLIGVRPRAITGGSAGGAAVDIRIEVGPIQPDGLVEIGERFRVLLEPEVGVTTGIEG